MKNLGIIGVGNMGSALLSGICNSNLKKELSILIYDVDRKKVEESKKAFDVREAENITELLKASEYTLLAIKPQDIDEFLKRYGDKIDSTSKLFITIAAGLKVKFYRKYLAKTNIARVMPNTPFLAGYGASGIYFDGEISEEDKNLVIRIFESGGIVEVVKKEALLDVVTGLSGSGPAFVFTFINSLADGGVFAGLSRDVSRRLAIQTVLGSAMLAQKENVHPEELKDRVTSPGGTTAAGLNALEEGNFRSSVIKAVIRATERAKELGENQ
ncbi:MAG: pyrroline-5-carboxylate reductase [Brevinematia bacterium]